MKKFLNSSVFLLIIILQSYNLSFSQTTSENYVYKLDNKYSTIGLSLIGVGFLEAIFLPKGTNPKQYNFESDLSELKIPYHKIVKRDYYNKNTGKRITGTISNYYYDDKGNEIYKNVDIMDISDYRYFDIRNEKEEYYNLKEEAAYDKTRQLRNLLTFTTTGIGFIFLGTGIVKTPVDYGVGPGLKSHKYFKPACYILGTAGILGGLLDFLIPDTSEKVWSIYNQKSENFSIKISPTILFSKDLASGFSIKLSF